MYAVHGSQKCFYARLSGCGVLFLHVVVYKRVMFVYGFRFLKLCTNIQNFYEKPFCRTKLKCKRA